jgi:thiol-disulfide isomerase/thioredoxin
MAKIRWPQIDAVVTVLLVAASAWALYRYIRGGNDEPSADLAARKTSISFFSNPKAVPPFAARDLEGRTITADSLKGKVTIINFWATWCPPCRAEMPDLVKLQDRYRGQLQIIGVSQDEGSPESVRKFAVSYGLNYPIVMTTPQLEQMFPVSAIPTSFIVDRDGNVVQKHVGMLNMETTELETRALAGLSVDVAVERIEDNSHTLLADNSQATSIPGISLDNMSPTVKEAILQKLNTDICPCKCGLTLAACRIKDPTCSFSLPLAKQAVIDLCAKLDPVCNPAPATP